MNIQAIIMFARKPAYFLVRRGLFLLSGVGTLKTSTSIVTALQSEKATNVVTDAVLLVASVALYGASEVLMQCHNKQLKASR